MFGYICKQRRVLMGDCQQIQPSYDLIRRTLVKMAGIGEEAVFVGRRNHLIDTDEVADQGIEFRIEDLIRTPHEGDELLRKKNRRRLRVGVVLQHSKGKGVQRCRSC